MSDVVVCVGSRAWDNHKIIRKVLASLPEGTIIRSGGAPGADTMCEWHGKRLGYEVDVIRPNYKKYGRWDAPKIRNTKLLVRKPRPKKVIAFWDGESGGTLDTITKACNRGIPVEIYTLQYASKKQLRGYQQYFDTENVKVKLA